MPLRHSQYFVWSAVVVGLLAATGCQSGEKASKGNVVVASSGGDAQHQISDLLDQYTNALLKKDTAALDRIWADDLSFINLNGELLNKQNRMDNIKTGATAFKSISVTDKRIRTYGDTAVATCQVALEAQYSGQEGSGTFGVTTVWARPKGMWQMVAVQMTRVAK